MKTPAETILGGTVAEHLLAFRKLCSQEEKAAVNAARKIMRECLSAVQAFAELEDYQFLSLLIEEFAELAIFCAENNGEEKK